MFFKTAKTLNPSVFCFALAFLLLVFSSNLVRAAPVNYSNCYAPDLCLTAEQAAVYNCTKVGVCGSWGLDRYSCPLAPSPSQDIVVSDITQSIQTNHWKIIKALNGIRGFITEIYADHIGFAFYDLNPMFVSFNESVAQGEVVSYAGATFSIDKIYPKSDGVYGLLVDVTVNTSVTPPAQPTPSPSPSPEPSPEASAVPTPSLEPSPVPSPEASPSLKPSPTIVITGTVTPNQTDQPLGDECSGLDSRTINQLPSFCKRGKWVPQLAAGSYCDSGFECESGKCEKNACTIPKESGPTGSFISSFFSGIVEFFRTLFGIGS